jgi:L-fuculose-phosphate aldolase
MLQRGLTTGTGGNLSAYSPSDGLYAISPSGIAYDEIRAQDIVVMDLEDNIVEGTQKPSSEYRMHRIFYRDRDDVLGVVHTHSIYTATFGALRQSVKAAHYLVGFGGVEIPCAQYATFGTEELAENAFRSAEGQNATLLANHGLIALGDSVERALDIAEEVEFAAQIYYRARTIGEPIILPEDEMKGIIDKFAGYGRRT